MRLTTAESRIEVLQAANVLNPVYAERMRLEEQAVFMQTGCLTVVPGFLETEAYAEALIARGRKGLSPLANEALVSVRLARGESLVGADSSPEKFVQVLLGEAVLRNEVAGRQAQVQQLDFLGRVASRWLAETRDGADQDEQSWLRVVPFSAGVVSDTVTLMKDPATWSLQVEARHFSRVWKGHDTFDQEAQRYVVDLQAMEAGALSPVESLDMIEHVRRQLQ